MDDMHCSLYGLGLRRVSAVYCSIVDIEDMEIYLWEDKVIIHFERGTSRGLAIEVMTSSVDAV